jgi:predicted dithiol-disulfide oxidoreductase (DUF899 family)
MHWFDFPGQDADYVRQRKELVAAEIALRNQIEAVAAQRRALPLGRRVPDYVFHEGPADLIRNDPSEFREARLSELFGPDHDTLIVVHLMFAPEDREPCVMCSMWADGYNAVAPHIEQHAGMALVAQAELSQLRRWARGRGWTRIPLISAHGNTFNRDLAFENEHGGQEPGLSVFTRLPNGELHLRYSIGAEFNTETNRGIDLYSPVWQLLDLLPAGRGQWYPAHSYVPAVAH